MTGWTCTCGASGLGGIRCPACGALAGWYAATVPAPPPARPPRAGLDGRGKALAVLVAVLLATGFTQVRARETAQRRAELRAVVADLMTYVAAAHGKPFREPVRADLLGGKAFRQALARAAEDDEVERRDWGATMVSLKLAEPEHLFDAAGTLRNEGPVGFYSHGTRRLYVRGRQITPYVRMILVHELTHAWQDQWYDLDGVYYGTDDDSAMATKALIEGDATRIQLRWLAGQSAADQASIRAADQPLHDAETRAARSLTALGEFPYAAGVRFAEAVAARGGNAAIERAFFHPPASTEQVLHPEKYFEDDRPDHVDVWDHDRVFAVDSGVLGELVLSLVVDDDEVAGWDGDYYVTTDDGDDLCTHVSVRMDTRADRDRLAAALRRVATGDSDVYAEDDRDLGFSFCVPSS